MSDDNGVGRDRSLGRALARLPVAEHAPGFFDELERRLREETPTIERTRPWAWLTPATATAAAALLAIVTTGLVVVWPTGGVIDAEQEAVSDVPTRDALLEIVPRRSDAPDGWYAYGKPETDTDVLRGMLRPQHALAIASDAGFVGAELTRFRKGVAEDAMAMVYAAYLFETPAQAAAAFEVIADDHRTGVDDTEMEVLPAPRVGQDQVRFRGEWNTLYPGRDRTITLWRDGSVIVDLGTTGLDPEEHDHLVTETHERLERSR